MPIERAVFHASAWSVYWTAPGAAPRPPVPGAPMFTAIGSLYVGTPPPTPTPPPPPPSTPVAAFTAIPQKPSGTVNVDGTSSYETNGSIARWTWDFGDGSSAVTTVTGTASYTYARSGTYSITLTVTDAVGVKAQTTHSIQVSLAVVPVASFSVSLSGMTVSVNAAASSSGNGSVTGYAWNFGDGATGSGVTASHTYSGGGSFPIVLTVTDNLGMTATLTHSVTVSSLPVANFTVSTSGLAAAVDASISSDPNPISSYDWNWNETLSLPSYSFGTVTKTATVTPATGAVIQCAVRSNDTGEYYITQRVLASGSETMESTQITRNDASGNKLDTSKFVEAGHGTSIALQYISGKVYIWMSWEAAAGSGPKYDLVRFPYPAAGTYSRSSPPPGMQVMYAGTGSKVDVQFDWLFNRGVVRTGTATTNTFQQVLLSDYIVGKKTVYNTVTVPVAPPSLQGFCTANYSLFLYYGVRYTRPSSTAPMIDTSDPPVLKEYRWYDGAVVATYNPSIWGKQADGTYPNNTYEPESSTIYVTSAGFPHVLFGWLTGTTNAYNYDIFQIPLNTTSTSVAAKHSSGKTASHTFAAAGTYQVALTIKDTVGNSDSQTNAVTVSTVANKPPTASFTFAARTGTEWNTVDFDASGSTDPDGTIIRYDWDFGQTTSTSPTPGARGYKYDVAGTYTVKLTVTDSSGASASITKSVTVTDGTVVTNKPPVASFTFAVSPTIWNRVDFDASGSTDSDGTIVRYDWDFQQSPLTRATPDAAGYIYNNAGTYTVKLTVTDDKGATGSQTQTVTVTAPVATNQPPSASFVWTATNLKVNFDASGSTDADGTIVRWDWDMQQSPFSSTTSPLAPGYVYNTAGTYTVKLTVTDDKGATGTTSKQVTVTAAPAPTPAPSGTIGDSGVNQTGASGRQQTGSNVVAISSVTGAGFSAAGAGKIASLPAGTFNLTNFAEAYGSGDYKAGAAISTGIAGIYGAGSASTVIQLPPGTTPPPYTQATHYMIIQGTNGNYTNPGAVPAGYIVDGVHIKGMQTSVNFGGIYTYGVNNFTLSNSTISDVRGSAGSPPGETFMWNFQRPAGPITVKNVTFDGTNEAAAGLGTNYQNAATVLNITDSVFKNTYISAGIAIHGAANGSTINVRNVTMTNNHRNFGIEANGGNANIYDPLWSDKNFQGSGHDFNITWTLNNYEGLIQIFFTSQANYNAFVAMRNNPKFLIIDNFQAYGDATGAAGTKYGGTKRIQDYFRVYIAGTLVGTGNSNYASGFQH